MNRGGFSWKRLLGVTKVKSSISRQIGIPLTSSGRQRKVGKAVGCATMIVTCALALLAAIVLLIR